MQRCISRFELLIESPSAFVLAHQAEIYFSVAQRKVLTPNDFADLDTLEQQLLAFGRRYEQIAAPFQWKFTRADLTSSRPGRRTRRPGSLINTSADFRARALS